MKLYDELAPFWRLMSPPARYRGEAKLYLRMLGAAAGRPVGSLLELGSGAGHHGSAMPPELDLVLLDYAPAMLSASRELNPGRVHVEADMTTARLGRTFDAVLLHDAVMYLDSVEKLRAACVTAAAHLAPGGAFLVVPDVVKETFREGSVSGGGADAERAVQMLEWHWDPDPTDDTSVVEFAVLVREGGVVRHVHEQHVMGLFDRMTIWRAIRDAGLEPVEADPLDSAKAGDVFLARRPGA